MMKRNSQSSVGWSLAAKAVLSLVLGLAMAAPAHAYQIVDLPTNQAVIAGTIVLQNEKDQFQFRVPASHSGLLSFVLTANDPRKQSDFLLTVGWTNVTVPVEDMIELAPSSKQVGFVTGPINIYVDVSMRRSSSQTEGYKLHFALSPAIGPPSPELTLLDLDDFGGPTADPVHLGNLVDKADRDRIGPVTMLSSSTTRDWKIRYDLWGTGFLLVSGLDTRVVLSLYSQDYVIDGRTRDTTKALFVDTGISRRTPITLNFGRASRLHESQQIEVRWIPVCPIDISPESESLGCPTADFSGDLPESQLFSLPLYTTKSVHFDIQDPSLGPVVIETVGSTLRTMIQLYSLDNGNSISFNQSSSANPESRIVTELLPGRYGILLFNPPANQAGTSRLYIHQEPNGAGLPGDSIAGYCQSPGSPILEIAEGQTQAALSAALESAGDVDAFWLRTAAGAGTMTLSAVGEPLRAVVTNPADSGFRIVDEDLNGQPLTWSQGSSGKLWCLSIASPSRDIGAYSLLLRVSP